MMDSEQLRLIRRMAKIEAGLADKAAGGELVSRMQLAAGGSASLSSAGHPLQVGETSGSNIIMDSRNIMARDNGSSATLYINKNGGDVMMPRLRLTAKGDASLTSNGHALQVGDAAGTNIIIDDNEIMARNNKEAAPLYLNLMGGGVTTPTVRLSATAVANLASFEHAMQIGQSDDRNLRASPYGVMSISNGAAAALHLNQYGGYVHVGYNASTDDQLTVNGNTVLNKGNTQVTLWTGTWEGGRISAPGYSKFTFFRVDISGAGTRIMAVGTSAWFRGMGGYSASSSNEVDYYINATVSGDDLTLVDAHSISGSGTRTPCKLTAIIGIL